MEWESAKFTIHKKGSVKINHVQKHQSENIVCLLVDFKEKYVLSDGRTNSETIKEIFLVSAKEDLKNTEFSFPEFHDWEYFSSHISRYTMFITLVRKLY